MYPNWRHSIVKKNISVTFVHFHTNLFLSFVCPFITMLNFFEQRYLLSRLDLTVKPGYLFFSLTVDDSDKLTAVEDEVGSFTLLFELALPLPSLSYKLRRLLKF